ncbi:MAG: GDSL-type esterase/lipase family protein [Flavobacteriaceae bacterium]
MNRRQFLNRSALAFIAASTASGCIDSKYFKFSKNQVVACFGDSITASKGGYVTLLQNTYIEKAPELGLRFLNYGKSSETVTGLTEKIHPGLRPYLFERLDDELAKEPIDVALFCYGINCGIYGEPSQALFDSFKIGVLSFLEKMRAQQIGVILLTPPPLALDAVVKTDLNTDLDFYGYLNPYPKYDAEVLQEFKRIIMNIEHAAVLAKIDIHTPLSQKRMSCYDNDPIHPNPLGHSLIASTIVEKIGF